MSSPAFLSWYRLFKSFLREDKDLVLLLSQYHSSLSGDTRSQGISSHVTKLHWNILVSAPEGLITTLPYDVYVIIKISVILEIFIGKIISTNGLYLMWTEFNDVNVALVWVNMNVALIWVMVHTHPACHTSFSHNSRVSCQKGPICHA